MSGPDHTGGKQASTRFQPGQSGNPKGRPKGARSVLGEAFLADLLADWEANGAAAIRMVRETKPEAYLKVVASILPRDLNVKVNAVDAMTDEQLVERIRVLDAAIRPFMEKDEESVTGKETAH